MEGDSHDVRSLLQSLNFRILFAQYVDIKSAPLQDTQITEAEPPGFSDAAYDVARSYERIKDYLCWANILNGTRKNMGERIGRVCEGSNEGYAGSLAGMQEVAFHLIVLAADSAAKHFRIICDSIGIQVEPEINDDIGMFGTIRNDFEHPDDRRGLSERFGKKIFSKTLAEDGTTQSFKWQHAYGDLVASRKGFVPVSDQGIAFHRQRVGEGIEALRKECIGKLVALAEHSTEDEKAIYWLLTRNITTTAGSIQE